MRNERDPTQLDLERMRRKATTGKPLSDWDREVEDAMYDWREAWKISRNAPPIDDVAEVLASSGGENDGDDWIAVCRMKDGRYMFLDAFCDYTGWDCQADGVCEYRNTLEELQRGAMGIDDRRRLGMLLPDDDKDPEPEPEPMPPEYWKAVFDAYWVDQQRRVKSRLEEMDPNTSDAALAALIDEQIKGKA